MYNRKMKLLRYVDTTIGRHIFINCIKLLTVYILLLSSYIPKNTYAVTRRMTDC